MKKSILQIVCVIFSLALNGQENLDSLLVAYYPFNNNAADESGFQNHAKIDAPHIATGFNGQDNSAYKFDGIDDIIYAPDVNQLFLNDDFTISAWVYPEEIKTQSIVRKGTNVNGIFQHPYGLSLSETHDVIFSMSNGEELFQARHHGYDVHTWSLITGVYKQGIMRLYINGGLVAEKLFSGHVVDDPHLFQIGRRLDLPSSTFNGIIDEVRIYKRALSEDEIQILFTDDCFPEANYVHIDTTFCNSQFLEIANLTITDTGTYYDTLESTTNCLVQYLEIQVSAIENPMPYEKTLVCTNILAVEENSFKIKWGDGQTGNTYLCANEGWHSYSLENEAGCTMQGSIFIEFQQEMYSENFLGNDIEICANEYTIVSPYENTIWPDHSTASSFRVTESSEIIVQAMNEFDCMLLDTIQISLKKPMNMYVPNIMRTDDNSKEDCFKIYTSDNEDIYNYELMVFDRWGNLVFQTKDSNDCWTGLFNGNPVSPGVYFYILNYQSDHCSEELKMTGSITVLS